MPKQYYCDFCLVLQYMTVRKNIPAAITGTDKTVGMLEAFLSAHHQYKIFFMHSIIFYFFIFFGTVAFGCGQ